jgi:3-phosphoshikimate 1-carboxyvinyltransferase
MQVRLQSAFLQGEINIIISKSYAHRLLILSALCDKPTKIIGRSTAKDVIATIDCLNALGAEILDTDDGYLVNPIRKTTGGVCNANESGSTLRFLLPVAAALGSDCTFVVEKRLGERPIKELVDTLNSKGVSITDTPPYMVNGKLCSGDFNIPGDISSQYISGLLFALPLLEGDSKIIIDGKIASESYVDITLDAISKFCITIEKTPYGFFIKGGQKYISPSTLQVEGDWSNAAFFLAAGAINGDIKVRGLNLNSKQGDKEILNVLKKMGADITINDTFVQVKKSNLSSIEIDADNVPDLVPIISVLAACANGHTIISGVERLRYKESDRIHSTMQMLKSLGIQTSYNGSLNITSGEITSGLVDGFFDHRIVMSASVASLKGTLPTTITKADAVEKSYPNFFEEYKKLGGKVDVSCK